MKKISAIILPLLFIASFAAAQQWKTFSNDSILFTAKYPPTWVQKIKEGKRVFFTSPLDNAADEFKENINISVKYSEQFGGAFKIKESVPAIIEELSKSFTDFAKESQRSFKWNGADAEEIIYTASYNNGGAALNVRFTQWFCVYKSRLYTVTFSAAVNNSTHNATAKKLMQSIVFKK